MTWTRTMVKEPFFNRETGQKIQPQDVIKGTNDNFKGSHCRQNLFLNFPFPFAPSALTWKQITAFFSQ